MTKVAIVGGSNRVIPARTIVCSSGTHTWIPRQKKVYEEYWQVLTGGYTGTQIIS